MPDFVGGGAPVTLNGQTWVTVIGPPGSGKKIQVLSVAPLNLDDVQHVFECRILVGATPYPLNTQTLAAGAEPGQLVSNCFVLTDTDEVFQVRTAEVTNTTQSACHVAGFEVP